MKILAISGSLRARSSNAAALRALRLVAPEGTDVELEASLDALPFFNPDVEEAGPPPAVIAWRERIRESAGLVISSPEYAHGVSGVLKNALDWLVGGVEISGKPVAVVNTRPQATIAHAALLETLRVMGGQIVAEPALPLAGRPLSDREIAADPQLAGILRSVLHALEEVARPRLQA